MKRLDDRVVYLYCNTPCHASCFTSFRPRACRFIGELTEQVRLHAASNRLKVGEFLPSVRQVAQELQINPMTVSKAYSILERDGSWKTCADRVCG